MSSTSVAVGFKPAIRRPETLADSTGQVETKRRCDLGSKGTVRGSRIDAGRHADGCQFLTVRNQVAIQSNPLAWVWTRLTGKPLQLSAPLVHKLRGLPTQPS